MTRDEVAALLLTGASSRVVFIRGRLLPEQIAAEIVALLNAGGGHLIIGIEEDGSVSDIDRHRLIELVSEICHNNVRPTVAARCEIVSFCGERKVAVVTSVSSKRTSVYRALQQGRWRTYIRVGTKSREASQREEELLCLGIPVNALQNEERWNMINYARPA